ncbi:uncharacterized protein si:ch211-156j16.1 [Electrophorus electricus]|uniref:uncharacterized protein si:ch211-156j16.1 n=1 Tax=Electrophorus electricus TaxID=8005 RepID=UPI0015D09F3A|nr:uncharacterized protein si:ch211-156j16.1 [Electrophorus electricus]
MKFQLLLLFALVGTFSTNAHASTLAVPTEAQLTERFQTTRAEAVTAPSQTDNLTATEEADQSTASFTVHSTETPLESSKPTAEKVESASTLHAHTITGKPDLAEVTTASEPVSEVTAKSEVHNGYNPESMVTGHVVGIAIGALVAMAILIAVIIVLVRRMGQYSP